MTNSSQNRVPQILAFHLPTSIAALALAAITILAILYTPPHLDAEFRIQLASQSLADARKSGELVPNSAISRMPLPEVSTANQRKDTFIAALLPEIIRENNHILMQREKASQLPTDGAAFKKLANEFGLDENVTRQKLLEHIDIIPPSLALAQGALESAWGRSRFARVGSAFFGERTFDSGTPGIVPLDASKDGVKFKVKSFASVRDSISSYFKTLNTHDAYTDLRKLRAALRASSQSINGVALASTLLKYSEIGEQYSERLLSTIRGSNLTEYDRMKLQH